MPTGVGKTEVFKNIDKLAYNKCLVLENRSDLRNQIAKRYENIKQKVFVCGSGNHITNNIIEENDIIVGTIQTVVKDAENISKDVFDIIIIDEFHHTE